MNSTLRIADLFAGLGGLSYPFEKYDAKVVFWSEKDPNAQASYIHFHGYSDRVNRDITSINPSDVPDHDMLLAGFPCQAFSIAGNQLGFDDPRGNLFFNIASILKEKSPNFFLLENVKNLKLHDKGRTYQTICHHLTSLGYGIKVKVLNAKHFALNQNRERIFILGLKNAWKTTPIPSPQEQHLLYTEIDKLINKFENNSFYDFKFPDNTNYAPALRHLTNGQYKTHLIDIDYNGVKKQACYYDPPPKSRRYFQSFDERNDWHKFYYTGKDGTFQKVTSFINGKIQGYENTYEFTNYSSEQWYDSSYQHIYQWRRKYVRKNMTGVCPTLTANMGTGGHNVPLIVCGKVSPTEVLIRKLTPEECLAFQGFDTEYIEKFKTLDVSNAQKYKQTGNSVPVPVIKAIVRSLIDYLVNIR